MRDNGRDARRRKGPDPRRVPVELLLIGYAGFVLLVIGAALHSEMGDRVANFGLLVTLGSAGWFAMRWIIAQNVRE